jgi:hypothetical protein
MPHFCIMAVQKEEDHKCQQGYDIIETLCTVGRNVKWYSHCEKHYEVSSKGF